MSTVDVYNRKMIVQTFKKKAVKLHHIVVKMRCPDLHPKTIQTTKVDK